MTSKMNDWPLKLKRIQNENTGLKLPLETFDTERGHLHSLEVRHALGTPALDEIIALHDNHAPLCKCSPGVLGALDDLLPLKSGVLGSHVSAGIRCSGAQPGLCRSWKSRRVKPSLVRIDAASWICGSICRRAARCLVPFMRLHPFQRKSE